MFNRRRFLSTIPAHAALLSRENSMIEEKEPIQIIRVRHAKSDEHMDIVTLSCIGEPEIEFSFMCTSDEALSMQRWERLKYIQDHSPDYLEGRFFRVKCIQTYTKRLASVTEGEIVTREI